MTNQTSLKDKIAAKLETEFGLYGFAESSVAQLQKASGVSLRTLYKYYPSKEAMIIGALENRHQRYLSILMTNIPAPGADAIIHIFEKLQYWMTHTAPNGCMSMQALAAFPENQQIQDAVNTHKQDVQEFLGQHSNRAELATALYVLHEGISSSWPVLGQESVIAANTAVRALLN
ncbi:TetR/AcrR family transcriptional regulator [Shewanella sp. 1CM18E]|uniref:TetR/AcrR family transcriptional regulator n=1 Tax=Shewanella sp. 1CM18E TaxID=2929169 RepID=UPI0020BF0B6B|nr:TetR/AcrR family transcriptional regulator [Shewanella sp. 1CM18E]MCK8046063.1 TetR/AcrR family transcriptional regulator [Shewanella sp. 1CM18E]